MYIGLDSENEKTPSKEIFSTLMISDDDDDNVMNLDDELSSSPMQDSYSSLNMIVNNKELEGTFENSKSSIGTKFDSEELNFFKLNKNKEIVKKEEIIKKIFEEAESKSEVEELNFKDESKNANDNLEESENEKRISDYIKQKFGNRKRKKDSNHCINNSEKKDDFISDFFDRGDKRKTKHYKPTFYLTKEILDEKEDNPEPDLDMENHNMEIDNIIEEKKNNSESELDIKDHKMKIDNTIEEKDDIFEDIDELLSFNDEYMDEEKTIENKDKKRDSEYEDIKNSINNLIPSVIDEINKNLDSQKALLNINDIEEPIISDKKKRESKTIYINIDIAEDDDNDTHMSGLDVYKKIHLTFHGYKLLPNQQFGRVYPMTLEVPETAKFRTVFKAYCSGTKQNEDEMLFNYNNIEIFSTSTLKGLDMTSSLENYRIDVFYRVEYPTYKHQLIVKQINEEEKLQKEKEQKEMELSIQNELQRSNFISDNDNLNDKNINIIIQDNNKDMKVLINTNATIRDLGFMYLEKLSLDKSLISKLSFSFDGQKLNNNQILKEIDIDNQDIIDLRMID